MEKSRKEMLMFALYGHQTLLTQDDKNKVIERVRGLIGQYERREGPFQRVKPATEGWMDRNRPVISDVLFDLKGNTWGQAEYRESAEGYFVVRFNAKEILRQGDAYDETIIHEVGHIIAYCLYGIKGWAHNDLWRMVVRALGGHPSRVGKF